MVPQAHNKIIDDRNDQLTDPNMGFGERGDKTMKGPLSSIGIYIGIWLYPYIESATMVGRQLSL